MKLSTFNFQRLSAILLALWAKVGQSPCVEQVNPKPTRRIEWIVWPALSLTVLVIGVVFVRSQIEQGQLPDLRPIAQVPEFTLTNQEGHAVSLADLQGNVWVADV